jgi:septum formation protein
VIVTAADHRFVLELDDDSKLTVARWLGGRRLTLASTSPRRRQILNELGVDFDVIPPGLSEEGRSDGLLPEKYALAQAICKLQSVEVDDGIVLAADTIVVCDGLILGKPADTGDARRILGLLAGRQHLVHTALALRDADTGKVVADVATSRVIFRQLSDQQIDGYIASGEPMDKAGAYGIQGMGELLVDRLDGSLSNVIGLPVKLLAKLLRELSSAV